MGSLTRLIGYVHGNGHIGQRQHSGPGWQKRNNQSADTAPLRLMTVILSARPHPEVSAVFTSFHHPPSFTVQQVSSSRVPTPDQAMLVETAINNNTSAAMKVSPSIDESDREGGGDVGKRATAGSYQHLSCYILLALTLTPIFQRAHRLKLWQTGNALVGGFVVNIIEFDVLPMVM